jgi:hypothetical protein
MATTIASVWGLNEKGEIVATPGTGSNNVVGYVNQDGVPLDESGKLVVAGLGGVSKYVPHISQYERALVFPQIRQANAVKGFSRNINDAQYVGAITDAEVYDTEIGALSVGQATSKALAFPWGKMLWDLAAGESLLVQARVKTVAATTSSNVLFGNSDATYEGFGLVLYGPTHATQAGRLLFNFKANGTAAQAIQSQPVVVSGATVAGQVLPTDTYLNITLHIDGATRKLDVWTNCQSSINAGQALNAGGTIPSTKHNFGLGYIPTDDGFTATTAKAARFQAFRMAVLPAGLKFINPGLLDWQFNVNPYRLFNDTDYVGAV